MLKRTKEDMMRKMGQKALQRQHAVASKKFMSELYEVTPVFNQVVVSVDENGSFVSTSELTVGGNSTLARFEGFTVNQEVQQVVVSEDINDNGNTRQLLVECGPDARYRIVEDILVVKFSNDAVSRFKEFREDYLYLDDSMNMTNKDNATYKYHLASWSPSGMKSRKTLWVEASNRTPQDIFDITNKLSGNAFDVLFNGQVKSSDKIIKGSARLGITTSTPMIDTLKVGYGTDYSILVLDTEIEGTEDFSNELAQDLKVLNIDIDNYTYDGFALCSTKLNKDLFAAKGFNISDQLARMIAPQARMDALLMKVFAEALDQDMINKVSEYLQKKYSNKCHVYGNGPISLVIDSNAAKMINNKQLATQACTYYILDIAKHSNSNTSGQMLDKLNDVYDLTSFMGVKAYETLDMCNDRKLDVGVKVSKKGNILGTAQEKILALNSEEALTDEAVIKTVMNDSIKKSTSMLTKLSVNIDAHFGRALFDATKLLTDGKLEYVLGYREDIKAVEVFYNDILIEKEEAIRVIEEDETLSNSEKTAKLDDILTGFMIKYPCSPKREFQLTRCLTTREVTLRTNVLARQYNLTHEEHNMTLRYINNTPFGTVKIAPVNGMKNKLAGMDTDYDGVVIVLEKELVDVAKSIVAREGDGPCVFINYEDNSEYCGEQLEVGKITKQDLEKLRVENAASLLD